MADDPERIIERAQVTRYRPPVHGIEDPIWIAEDPETDYTGFGHIEEEAVANLASVVVTEGTPGVEDAEYVKLPGEVVEKTWTGKRSGFWDRLSKLF